MSFAEHMVKSLTAVKSDSCYPVEVKDTKTMGKGVFATEDIIKGTVCCFYDGVFVNSEEESTIVTGKRGFIQYSTPNSCGKTSIIAGFPQQFRKGGCSQMINDYKINYKEEDAICDGINVITCTNHPILKGTPLTIAMKNIKKGEQLFVSYGELYWKAEKDAADRYNIDMHTLTVETFIRDCIKGLEKNTMNRLMKEFEWNDFTLSGVQKRYNLFNKYF